jgi:hypothetical protein
MDQNHGYFIHLRYKSEEYYWIRFQITHPVIYKIEKYNIFSIKFEK